MNKKLLIGVVVALLAVGGAAVVVFSQKDGVDTSNGKNQQVTGRTAEKSESGTTTGNSQAVATSMVRIDNFAFSPATITVKQGTTVTWTNKDNAPHTVTVDSGAGPASDTLQKGDTYTFTFKQAGTFAYHCNFHSGMTGTVIVSE